MKRTSKILFGIIAGLVVVVIALAIGARIHIGSIIGSGNNDGAGNVDLTMDGGELFGRIGGVGSVTYAGEVSSESVRFDGLGSVERR